MMPVLPLLNTVTKEKTMNDVVNFAAKLAGPAKAKQRRAELLAELGRGFANGGPKAVTDEMTHRIDTLADSFSDQLEELKKQL
jgi:hypothetical protein